MTSRSLARSVAAVGTVALLAGPMATGAQAAAKRKPAAPTILAKPSSPTNQRSATFEFAHPTPGVTYLCSLDGTAFVACTSPRTYEGPLSQGTHVFGVRVRDTNGMTSPVAQASWTIDLTPPAAPALSGVPSSPTGATSATLNFASAEAGATFACSLDNAEATPCTSPMALTGLAEGPHTFTVTARDQAGNVGSPAVGAWTIDTTPPPAPSITTGPANPTNATTATFSVFNSDSGATLSCSLDGGAFTACPDPLTYSGLGEGEHTFDARASDPLGNHATKRHTWTVDLTAPTPPAILSGPDAQTRHAAASFTFHGFDAVELSCSIDGAAFAPCLPAFTTPALADGHHTLHVKGLDAAGNPSGATPYAWFVDNTPPPAATVGGPATLTSSKSATFTIANTESLVTFTCSIDGGSHVPCESGVTYSGLPDGAHTLVVRSLDSLGNFTDATHGWTVDAVAPTVAFTRPGTVTGLPSVAFSEDVNGVSASSFALRLSSTATTLPATLACADAALATVSCATGAVRTATLRPAAMLVPGERYTVVVGPGSAPAIADAAGNALAPATFAFRAQTVLQETSPAAAYTWRQVGTTAAYGGSYRTDNLAGSSVAYPFTGTAITWYTVKGKSQGLADVYVDGVKKATVNNYSSRGSFKVARTVSGLAAGAHVLKIVVRGVKGSTAGTGTYVAVDAVKVGTTLTANPALRYGWRVSSSSLANGGAHAVANLAGQQTALRFRGTSISWFTSTGRNRGIVKVYVDGVLRATVDNYATSTTYNVRRTITGLSDTRHTVRVVVTGTKRAAATGRFLTLDRWVVG